MLISIERKGFDRKLTIKENLIIERDLVHIRWRYFKHRGIRNMAHLTRNRILYALDDYVNTGIENDKLATMEDWKDFIDIFNNEGGIEFLEFHAWLS